MLALFIIVVEAKTMKEPWFEEYFDVVEDGSVVVENDDDEDEVDVNRAM